MKTSIPTIARLLLTIGFGAAFIIAATTIGIAGGNRGPGQTLSQKVNESPLVAATKVQGCGPANGAGRVPSGEAIAPIVAGAIPKPLLPLTNLSPTNNGSANSASTTSWNQIPLRPRVPATPPSRDGGGSAYDGARGVAVVFGGRHFDPNFVFSQLSDTWTWDGSIWTQKHPNTAPPARFFTVMAYDGSIGKTILFGGEAVGGTTADLNDTWAWDGSNWTQIMTPTSPPARHGASLAYDSEHQLFILFGGFVSTPAGVTQYLNDTWAFDGANWTPITTVLSPTPRGADGILMTYVPANHGLVLFGGSDPTGSKNDTWLFDGSKWAPLLPTTSPPASFDPVLTYDATRSKAVLYRSESDTWLWDGQNWQATNATSPPSRFGGVYVYDTAAGKVLMSLGTNCLPEFDDAWSWDGTSWSQIDQGDKSPPQRGLDSNQIAFDTVRNQAVLFSGSREGCSLLLDTWTWNGTAWNWVHPPTSAPPRAYSAMAYDAERQQTVLFGGRVTPSTQNNDTWVFDGVTWARKFPLQSPSNREGMGMAFDTATRKVILFGGSSLGASSYFNETWSWDGTNWSRESPSLSPSGRVYLNMSHNAQGRPVVFGGQNANNTYPNDTWRWNGITRNWEQIVTSTAPPGRYAAGMGYDASSQSIILFGGQDSLQVHGDTWAFDGSNWQLLNPAASPSSRNFPAISDGSATNPPVLMGGGHFIGQGAADSWTWGTATPLPVPLASVASRKTHGSVGQFDINLPLTGNPGIECRSGGANGDYTLVFTFVNTLTSVGGASVSAGTGNVTNGAIDSTDAHRYIVDLTGVTNTQTITVGLTNVTDSVGNNSTIVSASMSILLGDTTGDGFVNSGDIAQTKSQSGAGLTNSNFREDVTADGFLNSGDIALVKSKSGTALPP